MSIDFPKDSKPYDRERPIHRVGSPRFRDPSPAQPSGKGARCGCRNSKNYVSRGRDVLDNAALSGEILITVPAWTPIRRERFDVAKWDDPGTSEKIEDEEEIEGIAIKSGQSRTDVPIGQIHQWYDWNFYVNPAKGFTHLLGPGNPDTVECEWDSAALGSYDMNGKGRPSLDSPGPMFERDWAWPMSGQYIWLAGRWVYDCGHPEHGFHRTEIHPPKAIASARWEAFGFDENDKRVPAIQFMFFACRNGGYWDFSEEAFTAYDYEFIVDLPAGVTAHEEFAIGRTPDFQKNTLVLGPRLLTKIDHAPFTNAHPPVAQPGEADPEIELLPVVNPAEPQARIRIPLTKLKGKNRNSYGVIVSLGWHDPDGVQAAKVKKVTVSIHGIRLDPDIEKNDVTRMIHRRAIHRFPNRPDGDFLYRRNWQVKLGLNGRRHALQNPEIRTKQRTDKPGFEINALRTHPVGPWVTELYLAEDDPIAINLHGFIERPVGEKMRQRLKSRMATDSRDRPYTWEQIDTRDDRLASEIAHRFLSEMFWIAGALKLEDSVRGGLRKALGIEASKFHKELEQNYEPPSVLAGKTPQNPTTVKDILGKSGPDQKWDGVLEAGKKPRTNYELLYFILISDPLLLCLAVCLQYLLLQPV